VTNVLEDTLFIAGLRDPARGYPDCSAWKRATAAFAARRATFVYQGGTRRNNQVWPRGFGDQLSGVIVVDSAGAPPDRIFVIGSWDGAPIPPVAESTYVMVMNGKTWPFTERIHARLGDTLHWRVVSVSPANHPMHLHGGYFRVDAAGNWRGDSAFTPEDRAMVATETLIGHESRTITWTPTRPGGWLFHCHDAFHVVASQHEDLARQPRAKDHVHSSVADHLARGMAGLIIGIEVEGTTAPAATTARRRLGVDLVTRERSGGSPPWIGFARPADSLTMPGPPLILTRGEPTAITVRNRLTEAASVHWHGIELESYYDGVAGWSGSGANRAPLIAPGDSFVAHMTPPRAGTFMYHAHVAELRLLASGMFGALIVLEPGQRWDPLRDHLLIFSQHGVVTPTDSGLIVLNARHEPAFGPLVAGVPNRLRLINISGGDMVEARIVQEDSVIRGRMLAKDGADLPAHRQVWRPAEVRFGAGETIDLEIVPRRGTVKVVVKSYNNFEVNVQVR
jgi:FtsP/CotA-like multicopper oxidase with cupredoxin domain